MLTVRSAYSLGLRQQRNVLMFICMCLVTTLLILHSSTLLSHVPNKTAVYAEDLLQIQKPEWVRIKAEERQLLQDNAYEPEQLPVAESKRPQLLYTTKSDLLKNATVPRKSKKAESVRPHLLHTSKTFLLKNVTVPIKSMVKNVAASIKRDCHDSPSSVCPDGIVSFRDYNHALESRSDANRFIILTMIDMGALTMGLNFWETSLVPYQIEAYLFVTTSSQACFALHKKRVPCVVYMEDRIGDGKSLYNGKDFLRKMLIRTFMILDALNLGYTVLHTDVDVIWAKNPFKYFGCAECDMAVLWDCGAWNAGFLYIRPTKQSIAVYQRMKVIGSDTTTDDQKALNIALKEHKRSMTVIKLNQNRFLCGKAYYEGNRSGKGGKRHFFNEQPCEACVVIHNNWIVSMEAKIYRFKENHQWVYDDDRYYSDPNRKYLTFGNAALKASPVTSMATMKNLEKGSLLSALAIGMVLNRTVILPRFHQTKLKVVSLLNHIKIREFDKVFSGSYRESSFLFHSKVPPQVKRSTTKMFFIGSAVALNVTSTAKTVPRYTPKHSQGATSDEILNWFGNMNQSVLKFHSLYSAFYKFTTQSEQELFDHMIETGIRPGRYRQF